MEPERLWWCGEGGWSERDPGADYGDEYAALTRADFDAREARLARAEQERDDLARLAYIDHEHRFPDATWKARCDELVPDLRAATARADALAALLKDAKEKMTDRDTFPVCLDAAIFVFLARIDAALEEKK